MMSMGVLSALQQAAATARRDLRALQKRPDSLAAADIMGAPARSTAVTSSLASNQRFCSVSPYLSHPCSPLQCCRSLAGFTAVQLVCLRARACLLSQI